jgi:hypothetical protein
MHSHLNLLDFIILIMLGEVYKLRSSSLCTFLQHPVTSALFVPDNLLSTLFSNTLSLYTSLNVRHQVFTPIQSHKQSYSFLYSNYNEFRQQRKDKSSGMNGSQHYPNSISS